MSPPSSSIPVAGVWKRLLEEDPLGDLETADRSTLVLWTQSQQSGLYVDLRLPENSPGRSIEAAAIVKPRPSALAANGIPVPATKEVLAPHVEILARQKSFAGVIDLQTGDTSDGSALKEDAVLRQYVQSVQDMDPSQRQQDGLIALCTCLWNRHMDYQPPTGGLDVGVCASQPARQLDGSLLLRETGDDASYAEDWLCQPPTEQGPFLALELVSEKNVEGARSGYWVRAGDQFAYAVGHPKTVTMANLLQCHPDAARIKECTGKSLHDAIQSLSSDPLVQLDLLTSYVCVTGVVSTNGSWTIQHSTNPELVGCTLFDSSIGNGMTATNVCSHLQAAQSNGKDTSDLVEQIVKGNGESTVKRIWRVKEMTDCTLPLSNAQ